MALHTRDDNFFKPGGKGFRGGRGAAGGDIEGILAEFESRPSLDIPPVQRDIGQIERDTSRISTGGISELRRGLNRTRQIRSENPIAQAEADARRLAEFSSGITRERGSARGAAVSLDLNRQGLEANRNAQESRDRQRREELILRAELREAEAEELRTPAVGERRGLTTADFSAASASLNAPDAFDERFANRRFFGTGGPPPLQPEILRGSDNVANSAKAAKDEFMAMQF